MAVAPAEKLHMGDAGSTAMNVDLNAQVHRPKPAVVPAVGWRLRLPRRWPQRRVLSSVKAPAWLARALSGRRHARWRS